MSHFSPPPLQHHTRLKGEFICVCRYRWCYDVVHKLNIRSDQTQVGLLRVWPICVFCCPDVVVLIKLNKKNVCAHNKLYERVRCGNILPRKKSRRAKNHFSFLCAIGIVSRNVFFSIEKWKCDFYTWQIIFCEKFNSI